MSELVSIIMPAYNAERWISDTIKSALNQTWQRKEIIIVDDGSTDNTLGIAKQFESVSLKVVSQPNAGAANARNKGLKFAQGDYIQWLDADDILAPDKITQQMKRVQDEQNDRLLLSGAWRRFFFCTERAQLRPNSLMMDLQPLEWLTRKMNDNVWMTVESWLISRKLTELAGPWNQEAYEDGEYICRVVSVSEKIEFVPEAISYYRVGIPGSMSRNLRWSDRALDGQWLSINSHVRLLLSVENSEKTRNACLRYLQEWVTYFYPHKVAIIALASSLAKELGGELSKPALSWKYGMIRWIFGWNMARRVATAAPAIKLQLFRNWDRLLYHLKIS